ncbi:MAG: ATP-binding protein [Propionibacteriaceae bacterium]|jgi:hypothetical protein|nr:ATP-binding protein [Propionibacteriaceae bacterium]
MVIGRRAEQAEMARLLRSPKPEFVAVYGRRRVGKTFLINQTAPRHAFKLTGQADTPTAGQLEAFNAAVRESGGAARPATSWREAFDVLRGLIETSTDPGKKVVFLDELPWLATDKSGFLPALEHFWNHWGSTRGDLLLIVCGSATTWMVEKLIRDSGGLYNRLTGLIHLKPFCLGECEEFFRQENLPANRYQIVESHMVFGGIPYYMSLMRPQYGLTQNVDALCFAETGILRTEFDAIYASLFKRPENYVAVVRALAKRAAGSTRAEIIALTGIANGGTLTKVLSDLVHSGFLREYHGFGKVERDSLFQLVDPFTLFYLRFMEGTSTRDPHYWSNFRPTGRHRAWSGYAFEQVALLHVEQIRTALGVSGVLTDYAAWTGGAGGEKAQIDLLLDRNDQVINLLEMKHSQGEFTVDAAAERAMIRKLSVFQAATRTKKAIVPTLVTTYGLTPNSHSGVFPNVVTMDDLFRIL